MPLNRADMCSIRDRRASRRESGLRGLLGKRGVPQSYGKSCSPRNTITVSHTPVYRADLSATRAAHSLSPVRRRIARATKFDDVHHFDPRWDKGACLSRSIASPYARDDSSLLSSWCTKRTCRCTAMVHRCPPPPAHTITGLEPKDTPDDAALSAPMGCTGAIPVY